MESGAGRSTLTSRRIQRLLVLPKTSTRWSKAWQWGCHPGLHDSLNLWKKCSTMTTFENLGAGNGCAQHIDCPICCWCLLWLWGQGRAPHPSLSGAGDAPHQNSKDQHFHHVLSDCSKWGSNGNSLPDMQIASASDGVGAGGETNIKLI